MRFLFLAIMLLVAASGCTSCDDLGDPDLDGCGDGVVRGGETCDGEDFGGLTCVDFGFTRGQLRCARSCAGVIVADCQGIETGPDVCAPRRGCSVDCQGEPYTSDEELQFDIATVPVTIQLTRGGEPLLPVDADRRGVLELRGQVWWEPSVVEVPADGESTVQTPLYPGVYRIFWKPERRDVVSPVSLGSVTVDAAQTLAFDLAPVREVSVSVTVNGNPFAESEYAAAHPGSRGVLVVETPETRSFAAAPLPDTGPAVVDLRLPPGTYHAWWVRGDSATIEYVDEIEVPDDGDVSIDLPVVRFEPQLTLNGLPPVLPTDVEFDATLVTARLHDGPDRIWSQWQRGDVATVELDRFGAGTRWMLAGRYDVRLQANAPRLQGLLHLRRELRIDASENAPHFDVPLTPVDGTVSRNGRRPPRSQLAGTPRGRLTFGRADGSYLSAPIAGSGPAEFSLALPPGTWNVRVSGAPWSASLPLVTATVREDLTIGNSPVGDLEIDVPAVRFVGQLTLDGERMPDELDAESRGDLQIAAHDGSLGYNLPISRTGPALFDLLLVPGEYDVQVTNWWFAVGESPPPDGILPLGTWRVGTVDVSSTTRRDIDLRTFPVTLRFTEGGEALPSTDSETRGEVWIEDVRATRVARRLDIPADGAAEVATTLYPGHYRVVFQPDPSMNSLPLQPVMIGTLAVGEEVDETYDVGGIRLSGSVTVNGEPLESGADGYGTVAFLRFPTVADTTVDAELDPDFDLLAAPGPYNVLFHPPPNHPQLPSGAVVLSDNCVDTRLE